MLSPLAIVGFQTVAVRPNQKHLDGEIETFCTRSPVIAVLWGFKEFHFFKRYGRGCPANLWDGCMNDYDWLIGVICCAVFIVIVILAVLKGKQQSRDSTTDGSDVDDIPRFVELSRENEALKRELSDANRRIASLRQDIDSADASQLRQENEALKKQLSDAKLQIGSLRRGTGSVDPSQLRKIKFPSVTKAREAELKAMDYREYLQTPEWTQRTDIMKNWFGNRCQACYSDGVLHVHHRTDRRRGNEHWTDLTVLCWECHQLIHERYPELGR